MSVFAAMGFAALPALSADMLVVFGIIFGAFVLFYSEWLPIDVIAILIVVTLIVLEPWTRISPREGISGFANPATITVMAMLFLAEGIRESGIIQIIGRKISDYAGNNKFKQLLTAVGLGGVPSGFINNTPVVAMLVPVISEMAKKGKNSPSKVLIPLSYASQLGGMLTLIGTSTNLLASDVSERLIGHPFSMFEFTALGFIVFVTGAAYLVFIAPFLLFERVKPEESELERYEVEEYLTEFTIGSKNIFLGQTVEDFTNDVEWNIKPILMHRGEESYGEPLDKKELREGDKLIIRVSLEGIKGLLGEPGFEPGPVSAGSGAPLSEEEKKQHLAEIIINQGSSLEGATLERTEFLDGYDAHVLALRSRGETFQRGLEDHILHTGDTLLIYTTQDSLNRMNRERDIILGRNVENPKYKLDKIPLVLVVMAGVVALPALGILPILVSSLLGMILMVTGGVMRFDDIYKRIDWNVIFLLAGIIPLGNALEKTGGAELIGNLIALSSEVLPVIGVLWIFYMVTAFFTNIISNNASVVLMIPVGIQAARLIGANPFAFVLAVTFAASTAFLTPIGYQTNLFVYGPGGYKFTDYSRVGAPLQILLSVVTVFGITWFWGL
jgi:di/tricarboxylate transporter